jgi:replicative DNA helicase
MAKPQQPDAAQQRVAWSTGFQDAAVAYLWRHPGALAAHEPHFKPSYVSVATTGVLLNLLVEHYRKFRISPTEATMRELVRIAHPQLNNQADTTKRNALDGKLTELLNLPLSDHKILDEKIREFVRYVALKNAIIDAKDDLLGGIYDPELPAKMRAALAVGDDKFDIGHIWQERSEERVMNEANPNHNPRIPTGLPHLDSLIGGGLQGGELGIILALPKGFKCHDENDQVMMFDGGVKFVKDVAVGDLLMGDDSTARRVMEVGRGSGPMYNVRQANGDPYKVTSDHILCLKRPDGTTPKGKSARTLHYSEPILEMTAKEYSTRTSGTKRVNFSRMWQGYKVEIDFPSKLVPIDPYYIGLWLGDGLNRGTGICVADGDVETHDYLHSMAEQWGLRISKEYKKLPSDASKLAKYVILHLSRIENAGSNALTNAIRSVGLGRNTTKHVPDLYKFNGRQVRLKVLAGMIDSGGHFRKNHGFIFVNTNKQLADDACWLARSLGFRAHVLRVKAICVKPDGSRVRSWSYRTMVQGRISEIPTKLPRKKAPDSVKVTNRTPLKVTPSGNGKWCGFRVDGNHRYLLADFTVTHNSGTLLNFGYSALRESVGMNVGYVTLELSEELVGLRFDYRCSLKSKEELLTDPHGFLETLKIRQDVICGANQLIIKEFKAKTCTCDTIRAWLDKLWSVHGIKINLLIVDYLNLLKPVRQRERAYLEAVDVCEDLRSLASKAEYNIPVWTASRATREAVGKRRINSSAMSAAFELVAVADLVLALVQDEEEKIARQMRIMSVAARNVAGDKVVDCKIVYEQYMINSIGISDPVFDDGDDAPKFKKGSNKKDPSEKDLKSEYVSDRH